MGFFFQSSGLNKIPDRLDKFGELFTECFHSLLFQKSTNTVRHVEVHSLSLFMNKKFMLNEILHRNTLKFGIL